MLLCLKLKYSLSVMYIELLFQLSFLILVPINIMRWPLPWYHTVVKISTSNRVFDPLEEENTADGYFNNIESALLHPNNSVWAQNDPFCFQT